VEKRKRGPRSQLSPSEPVSWTKVLPVLLLIGAVQASVLLPGTLVRPVYFWISTGLLLTLPLLFWNRYPRSILAPALIYVASACCLTLAASPNSGLGVLLFLPVVGVALLGTRRQCGITLVAVVIGTVLIALGDGVSSTTVVRRAALFLGIALVISMAIVALREPLVRSRERARLLLKDARAINDMARRLAVLTEPASIKRMAAELAATVGSPPGSTSRRGAFLSIEDGATCVDSQFDQFDDAGSAIDVAWPTPDDPLVEQAIRTREAASGVLIDPVSPRSSSSGPDHEATYAAWVPIAPQGELQGLLGVATQREPVPETSLDQLVGLGHLVELALSNWSAHEKLEEVATREDRRRIARDLHDGLAQELAFIASKAMSSQLTEGRPQAIRQLADAADRALDEARRAIVILSEAPESLHVAISQTAEDLAARHGMVARLQVSDDIVLSGDVTENLLRIVREAITNAARHGHASTISLTLARDGDVVRLLVSDDGQGFCEEQQRAPRGYGLTFMEERCASIGGSLDLTSRPGDGVRVEVRLPA
jgi:signal transduction histidine kinase